MERHRAMAWVLLLPAATLQMSGQGVSLTAVRCLASTAQLSGQCVSLTEVDLAVQRWLFVFGVANVFVGSMIGSTLVQTVETIATSVSRFLLRR